MLFISDTHHPTLTKMTFQPTHLSTLGLGYVFLRIDPTDRNVLEREA